MATVYKAASVGYWAPRLAMAFLPDVLIKHLKEAMDPRESLHVADLGKANFSATMGNVDEPERWYAPDAWPVKARNVL